MIEEIIKNKGLSQEVLEGYKHVLEILSQSTDDFLFLHDMIRDKNWFYGDIDKDFAIREPGDTTNTVAQVMRIVYPSDRPLLERDIRALKSGKKEIHDLDYRWVNVRGQIVWVNCRGRVIKNADGKPVVRIGRVSQVALRHMYNPLTGLFNQNKMMQRLKEALARKQGGYLFLVDIDDLSAININHGRAYGDVLLKDLALALENHALVKNVYHTERNYFAALIDTESEEDVFSVYEDLKKLMEEKCTLTAGASPISSIFSSESNLYDAVKIILRKAKNSGKNKLEFFSLVEVEQKLQDMEILQEMREQIAQDCEGFVIMYQPQVKAGNYALHGVEVLLRYRSRTGEMIFPDRFIPLLEQSGLIVPVGAWVLRRALLQCKRWQTSVPGMRISVNFSMVQFRDPTIVEQVRSILKETGMSGKSLTVEITESVPVHEIDQIAETIAELKHEGVEFAIDDFGTGYSNIGYLKQLDVDEIKIDRMFVKDIEKDTYNYKLVSNMLEFAKMNALRVCCEGVETPKELAVLESYSPDLMQGYLFDKPCDEKTFTERYVDNDTEKYKARERFIENLYQYREEMSMIHFDPKDILRETGVGLWIVRAQEETGLYEMHVDETMERVLGIESKLTPQECYAFWYDRVPPKSKEYIEKSLRHMAKMRKVVQLEYKWNHPVFGQVMVRSSGRRTADCAGMVVLEGYHRIFSNIEEL